MKEVYGKIYDIMYGNLEKSGNLECFNKNAFLTVTEKNIVETDINDLKKLSNNEFLEASYMEYFNRTVDDGAMSHWSKKFEEDEEKFKSQLTNQLTRSFEFKINNSKVINNCYSNTSLTVNKVRDNKIVRFIFFKLYFLYCKTIKPIKLKFSVMIRKE